MIRAIAIVISALGSTTTLYWGWCKYSQCKILFTNQVSPIRGIIKESKERIAATQRAAA